jgi:iron-sulfur cluster insertion protein
LAEPFTLETKNIFMLLTEAALKKIKEISDSEGIGHLSVRFKVIGGGCAGMTHDMEFCESTHDSDVLLNQEDIRLIIDPISMQYLENCIVDYEETNLGGGFRFKSPDIKGTCGCGNSYSY